MNVYSAIRDLRDGQAVKPSNWRGYVERIDKPIVEAEYNATSGTYTAGVSKVKYNNRRYVCIADVVTPEAFDFAKWLAIGQDYNIVFVDSDDASPTQNPSAIYTAAIGTSNDIVTWSRLGNADTIPAEVAAKHPPWTSIPTPVDMPDTELFKAMLADSWELASAADYESQRSHGGGRW